MLRQFGTYKRKGSPPRILCNLIGEKDLKLAENNENDRFEPLAEVAKRILNAYGHAEPDSTRIVYTSGDLNIACDAGVLEIIHRGTLVFRDAPECASDERSFNEDDWMKEVEQAAQTISNPPLPEKASEQAG